MKERLKGDERAEQIAIIRNYVYARLLRISDTIESIGGSRVDISDPFASHVGNEVVREWGPKFENEFSKVTWVRLPVVDGDGRWHVFQYIPELDAVVDLTYRQFFRDWKNSDFNKLDKVFVGKRKDYLDLMSEALPKKKINEMSDAMDEWPH